MYLPYIIFLRNTFFDGTDIETVLKQLISTVIFLLSPQYYSQRIGEYSFIITHYKI